MKNQGDFLDDLSLMLGELSGDMSLCERSMQESQASWRRLYVRSTFASIEALAFFLKQHTLNNQMLAVYDSFKSDKPELPLCELALLMEESYTLKDNGKPKKNKAKLRTIPNLLFALSAFGQSVGSGHEIAKDDGFAALTKAIAIRDRLTHPKDLKALTVTDDEMDTLKKAFNWVRREFTRIIKHTPRATIEETEPPNQKKG